MSSRVRVSQGSEDIKTRGKETTHTKLMGTDHSIVQCQCRSKKTLRKIHNPASSHLISNLAFVIFQFPLFWGVQFHCVGGSELDQGREESYKETSVKHQQTLRARKLTED